MSQTGQGTKTTAEYESSMPLEYFCEVCGHYPIVAAHGHFECPMCRYKTKCCEGMALDNE